MSCACVALIKQMAKINAALNLILKVFLSFMLVNNWFLVYESDNMTQHQTNGYKKILFLTESIVFEYFVILYHQPTIL